MEMRTFDHPNMDNFRCPVCNTSIDAPVILRGIPGTEEDGNQEAEQVHACCYELVLWHKVVEQLAK